MAINYTNMRLLAERLIGENGRTVTLVRKDQGNPVDPAMPWRASTNASEITLSVTAVLVPFEFESETGGIVKRDSQMALVAAKDIDDGNPANTKLEEWDELLDADGVRYRIVDGKLIAPGPSRVLYMLEVKQ